MSPPSSMSKGESDSSAKKKQLGIKRFFSPGSDGGDVVDNSEPAMRKRQSVKDTIRQLIQSGELEGVSLNETSVANIAEKVSANKPMNQGHHGKDQGHEGKKGGRPYMPNHLKRGIHGGATSNIRKKMRSQGSGSCRYQPSMRFARSLMGQGQNSQISVICSTISASS